MLDLSDMLDSPTKGAESLEAMISKIKVPPIELSAHKEKKEDNIFEEHKHKAWDKSEAARCNFDYRLHMKRRGDVNFVAIWQKSIMGRTLVDIKSDENEIKHFADSITPVIKECLGYNLSEGDWCICTSPKRRHKEKNFASLISEQIALMLGIPFYEDVAYCHSKHRMDAVFTLNVLPKERNVIVFDDFVTTGSTLKSMKALLAPLGKNLVFFTCVDNKLN